MKAMVVDAAHGFLMTDGRANDIFKIFKVRVTNLSVTRTVLMSSIYIFRDVDEGQFKFQST